MNRFETHTGVLLGLLLMLLAPACGGSSGDGGVTPDTGCLVYEPLKTPAPGEVAARSGVGEPLIST